MRYEIELTTLNDATVCVYFRTMFCSYHPSTTQTNSTSLSLFYSTLGVAIPPKK